MDLVVATDFARLCVDDAGGVWRVAVIGVHRPYPTCELYEQAKRS